MSVEPPRRRPRELNITQLVPNLMTLGAICAGLTAIRFGYHGNFETAVLLILVAAVLDALDGRIARFLKSDSEMGAELDSLADFVNFGVAPALLLYIWGLQPLHGAGWIAALIFSICCLIRLARFNVAAKNEEAVVDKRYFVGVPAPAGALLVLLPMFAAFASDGALRLPALAMCFYMGLVGYLMISRIPTRSFKDQTVSRENVKFLLLAIVFVAAAVFTYPWVTLVGLALAYIGVVLVGIFGGRRPAK
ncbi:MAG: CDP-diacylglycerol--serine O-phosphatidyltransferase [Paracoccaceae bacterium]